MIYKNIEIHNAAELVECEGGGTAWLRFPKSVCDTIESDQGKRMCKGSTGVELRFVPVSDEVKIVIQSLSSESVVTTFHVYYGNIQGGWEAHEVNKIIKNEPCEFTFKKPENIADLKKIADEFNHDFDPEVIRVIFDRGEYKIIDVIGEVRPPKKEQLPKKTLLCYGSSITHGSNSIDASHSWTSVLARGLNYDLRNLGMAGSCLMEPEIIDYIASQGETGAWDMATLELGINVLGWEEAKIYERVENTISMVAGRNPDKKVFVISPFYANDDFYGGGLAEKWRRIVPEICEKLNFSNVTYIDGKDVLGDISLISADMVHPNLEGVAQIAQRLYEIIKSS